jgi:hypothetical protein
MLKELQPPSNDCQEKPTCKNNLLLVNFSLDLRDSIPTNLYVTGGQVHDVHILDKLFLEAGAFYLLDRGYVEFARLYTFT